MGASCVYKPTLPNGEESKLFNDLQRVVKNREQLKKLYVLFTSPKIQESLEITEFDENGEPTIKAVLNSLTNPENFLKSSELSEFIKIAEDLNTPIENHDKAVDKVVQLSKKYKTKAFQIRKNSKTGYSIIDKERAVGLQEMKESVFRGKLQNRLLNYMNDLGFDVRIDTTVGNMSRFSPIEARENARKLKEIIMLSKGQIGEIDFIEEFSHLIVEGLHAHPLVQRLLSTINDSVVEEILGENLDQYKELYKNNPELLKKEAAGRIVALAIAKNEGDFVRKSLAGKTLNAALSKFSEGNLNEIDTLISAAMDEAAELVGIMSEPETIEMFDKQAVIRAQSMFRVADESISNLQSIAESALKTAAKKMKLTASRERRSRVIAKNFAMLNDIEEAYDKAEYADSCVAFLRFAYDDIKGAFNSINRFKERINENENMEASDIRQTARILVNISNALVAYTPLVRSMAALDTYLPEASTELTKEMLEEIKTTAGELNNTIAALNEVYSKTRFTLIYKFFQQFWGDSKIIDSLNGSKKEISLKDILQTAPADTTAINRFINSLEDSPDMLLSLVDGVIKSAAHKRDLMINSVRKTIESIFDEYVKASGSRDTSFMFEKDENGKPTGFLISDRDYGKYRQARWRYIESLKQQVEEGKFDYAESLIRLKKWEEKNTDIISITESRSEAVPKKELYAAKSPRERLTKAQYTYYTKMLDLKVGLESYLPSKYHKKYRAIQIQAKGLDVIEQKAQKTVSTVKQAFDNLKNSLNMNEQDTDYGTAVIDEETGELYDDKKTKNVLLDFAGNPVSTVPVYYTRLLKDPSFLSTNFTDAMLAFTGMVCNFDQMDKIADILNLTKEMVGSTDEYGRKVDMREDGKVLVGKWTVGRNKYSQDAKNVGHNIYQQLEDAINTFIYGKTKNRDTITIKTADGDKTISYGKILDKFKWLKTMVGMGYNAFSSVSNVTMGNNQLMLYAIGNSYTKEGFNIKEALKAIGIYNKMLPSNIANIYNIKKKDKLSLLIRMFDPMEELKQETADSDIAKSAFRKTLNIFSPLQGMSAGEHYLHCVPMIAELLHNKVLLTNKSGSTEISLYDALEVKESNDGTFDLVVKDGVTTLDGKAIDTEYLYNIKNNIRLANHKISGDYSEFGKGQLTHSVFGRLLMQFRQWMPAYFMDRYKSARINTATGKEEEGFHRTAITYFLGTAADLLTFKLKIGTRWKKMSKYQRANVIKSVAEFCMFAILAGILKYNGEPDKDDSLLANFSRSIGYRTKMELASSNILNPAFYSNVMTLMHTPMPAMEGLDYFFGMINPFNFFDKIESGKYKGWTKWKKYAYYSVPFARNIGRINDLQEGDFSMFNPYIKNN